LVEHARCVTPSTTEPTSTTPSSSYPPTRSKSLWNPSRHQDFSSRSLFSYSLWAPEGHHALLAVAPLLPATPRQTEETRSTASPSGTSSPSETCQDAFSRCNRARLLLRPWF
jgi:hypothetical protein